MSVKYNHRISIYVLFFLTLFFTGLALIFFLNKEKRLKNRIAEQHPLIYSKIIDGYIAENQENINKLSILVSSFPQKTHLTVFDKEGTVIYDNQLLLDEEKESHPIEIQKILESCNGKEIWKIADTDSYFSYYAIRRNDRIICIGFPCLSEMREHQKPDASSIGFSIFLFLLVLFAFSFILIYFKQSIKNLTYSVLSFHNQKRIPAGFFIKDRELREIQSKIMEIYDCKSSNKEALVNTEKLLQHFRFAEEGISFFTSSYSNIYTNSHFIQHLNVILNQPTFDVNVLFSNPVFDEVVSFLKNPKRKNTFGTKIHANGSHFFVQVIIFDDKSFEIIIRNISQTEKNTFDRTLMTNNIAHELRTPVTSVCAYLETLIDHKNMSSEKKEDYIHRAYVQILRLSEMIQDVTLLTRTEEAPQGFSLEEVNIYDILLEMIEVNAKRYIEKTKNTIYLLVSPDVIIEGNPTLLYAIFRNLLNNALQYSGENTIITIHNYMEDSNYYYFSFSDNGKGVEEKYIDHIFERFYRATEGRTRDKGGSGLGLAIVKEAILFHHGEISVKNRAEGGLEFLFTIRKRCDNQKYYSFLNGNERFGIAKQV
jgi:nitrogen-specific signal transduction histidine kinase